jgi:hypothetical protein
MEVHLAWRFTRIFGRAVDNFTSEKIRELGTTSICTVMLRLSVDLVKNWWTDIHVEAMVLPG